MCLKKPTAKETYEESTPENLGELHNVDEEAHGSDWTWLYWKAHPHHQGHTVTL